MQRHYSNFESHLCCCCFTEDESTTFDQTKVETEIFICPALIFGFIGALFHSSSSGAKSQDTFLLGREKGIHLIFFQSLLRSLLDFCVCKLTYTKERKKRRKALARTTRERLFALVLACLSFLFFFYYIKKRFVRILEEKHLHFLFPAF